MRRWGVQGGEAPWSLLARFLGKRMAVARKADAPDTLPVIEATRDLLKWLLPHLNKFPKTHRFVLADKMEHKALDLLLVLINARYSKRRRATARSQFGLQSRSARAERPPRRE